MNTNQNQGGRCCAGGEPVKGQAAGGRTKRLKSTPRKASSTRARGMAVPGKAAREAAGAVGQVVDPVLVGGVPVGGEAGGVAGVLVELRVGVVAGFVFRLVAGKGGRR